MSERLGEQAERHCDKDQVTEFSLPTWMLLNALEGLGYKVKIQFTEVILKFREGFKKYFFPINLFSLNEFLGVNISLEQPSSIGSSSELLNERQNILYWKIP